jgi:NAD(P)-dependent dehydrogenase (short-subunit alcohol dehydrogenase family)
LQAQGVRAEGAVADVTTETGRAVSLRNSLTLLGGLDIVVNNAGGVRASRLEKITEDIIEMVQVNLLAPMLLTRMAPSAPAFEWRRVDCQRHFRSRTHRNAVLRHLIVEPKPAL